MKLDLQRYAKELQDIFELKLEIKVLVRPLKNFQGFYELRLNVVYDEDDTPEYYHEIVVSPKCNFTNEDYKSTLAHEFVHAWQHENEIKVDHGPEFMKWVDYFKANYDLDISSDDCYDNE